MNRRSLFATPYIIWIIGFTILPIVILLFYGLSDGNGSFTGANVLAIFARVHLKSLWMSVKLALICTVICFALAYPLALFFRKLAVNRRGMLLFIVIVPMWMNFVLRIMSWQLILSKNGVLNHALSLLGLPGQNWGNSAVAIVIGMVYDYLPFMILPIYNAVMDVAQNVIDAARDLGAGPGAVVSKVMLPLTKPGIISGITMVFVPTLTTFAISDMLGGGKVMLIGNIIEQEFTTAMNWNLGAGLSLALMIFVLISMFFAFRSDKENKERTIW